MQCRRVSIRYISSRVAFPISATIPAPGGLSRTPKSPPALFNQESSLFTTNTIIVGADSYNSISRSLGVLPQSIYPDDKQKGAFIDNVSYPWEDKGDSASRDWCLHCLVTCRLCPYRPQRLGRLFPFIDCPMQRCIVEFFIGDFHMHLDSGGGHQYRRLM